MPVNPIEIPDPESFGQVVRRRIRELRATQESVAQAARNVYEDDAFSKGWLNNVVNGRGDAWEARLLEQLSTVLEWPEDALETVAEGTNPEQLPETSRHQLTERRKRAARDVDALRRDVDELRAELGKVRRLLEKLNDREEDQ